MVQSYAVSDAAVHDSQVFEVLLDQTVDAQGKRRQMVLPADGVVESRPVRTGYVCRGLRHDAWVVSGLTESQRASLLGKSQ